MQASLGRGGVHQRSGPTSEQAVPLLFRRGGSTISTTVPSTASMAGAITAGADSIVSGFSKSRSSRVVSS